ncbi:hypothetical protein BDV28DRAFT_151881 [Aspergillus coremiiformis]|uniref:Rhodopsin domain-containing protein n=1 Tax=Aspergillus coremiiformis TaxID=138285 RepID=A0A5N6YVD6_9EURO|nr:hypothetical protein BDV28DRAFT_151881 [Aspergillus coremiiformis]
MHDSRLVESWAWFAVTTAVTICRYISRYMLVGGFKGLMVDDYIMLLTYGFYTNFIIWVNIQAEHPKTNILPPTGMQGFTEQDIQERIFGSKITFILEQSMVVVQWGCKASMIMVYYRLTSGTKMALAVKILMGYIAASFVIVEIFFYGVWCRPFSNYFAVKADYDPQCGPAQHHLIMSYAFNLSSDLAMLCIPVPVFIGLQLLWKKKIGLLAVFGLGIFVVVAATLSRYYCFTHPNSIAWIFWYVREASTAVIVTNVPNCYTLLRRMKVKGFTIFGTYATLRRKRMHFPDSRGPSELVQFSTGRSRKHTLSTESTEHITGDDRGLEIWQHTQVAVYEELAEPPRAVLEQDRRDIYGNGTGLAMSSVTTCRPDVPDGMDGPRSHRHPSV